MRTTRGLRLAAPATLVTGLFLACVITTDPRGQFPLNDDWAYSRSAFALGSGHGLRVDEWSAPSLIGQTFYGGLLARLAGENFTALRLSTVVLSAAALWLLCHLFSMRGVPPPVVVAAAAAWALNPLGFCLSLTFMTEMPFLFTVVAAVYVLFRHGDEPGNTSCIVAGSILGYGFLIRQTSILFLIPAAAIPLLAGHSDDFRRRVGKSLRIVLPGAAAIAGYYLWLLGNGGATPAARRKFELLRHVTGEQLIGNAFGIFFYLSFLLLPVWILLLPKAWALARRGGALKRWLIPVFYVSTALGGLTWFRFHYSGAEYLPGKSFHAQMPFLLNVLYDTGLGPVTLDPTYYGPPATPTYPGIWAAVTWLTAAGSAVLCSLVTWVLLEMGVGEILRRPMLIFGLATFLSVAAFETVFSHLQEGGLFDRHLLTALLPILLLIVECVRAQPQRDTLAPKGGHLWSTVAATAVALGMGWFSVTATHDYLEWNRLRWSLGTELLRSGVDPLVVSGGFEFNAWHNYDAFRQRGNIGKVYFWWYDRRDYLIAMSVPEGYEAIESRSFRSWLHRRPVTVYALRKL